MELSKIYDTDHGMRLFVEYISSKQKRVAEKIDLTHLVPFIVRALKSNITSRAMLDSGIKQILSDAYPELKYEMKIHKADWHTLSHVEISYLNGPLPLDVQILLEKKLKLQKHVFVKRFYCCDTLRKAIKEFQPAGMLDLIEVVPDESKGEPAGLIVPSAKGAEEKNELQAECTINIIMRHLGKKRFIKRSGYGL